MKVFAFCDNVSWMDLIIIFIKKIFGLQNNRIIRDCMVEMETTEATIDEVVDVTKLPETDYTYCLSFNYPKDPDRWVEVYLLKQDVERIIQKLTIN